MIRPQETVDPHLETDRTRLRPMLAEDVDLARALLTDAAVMRYVTDPVPPDAVASGMDTWTRRGAGGRLGIWAVIDKDTDAKLGDCVLLPLPIDAEDTVWDEVRPDHWPPGPIEVGYLLRPEAWGRGLATEICARLLRFGFETAGMRQIYAVADPGNTASHNVLRKCGLRSLGKRRAYGCDDTSWFCITGSAWAAQASHQYPSGSPG